MALESRRTQAQHANIRRRRSQEIRIEATIGGWNTRDSADNLPPTDALILDNIIPDIGKVKVRKGSEIHSDSADLASNIVLNPGFETAGGGGADIFANWTEHAGTGTLARIGGGYQRSGSWCCDIFPNYPTDDVYVKQTIAVSASTKYRLRFWARTVIPGSYYYTSARYRVYDNTNAADIIPITFTGIQTQTYTQVIADFTTPVGCVSVDIYLYGGYNIGEEYFFDDVSLSAVGPVESLMIYRAAGVEKFLAADNGNIYDVTIKLSPVSISGGTGFNSNRWQYVNFDGKMGMVNTSTSDAPQQYDGSTISALTLTGSGLTANNVIGIHVFKNRTWFWESGKQDVWYSALNTLGGALTKFPLSYLANFGGDLISVQTWTHDGGSGIDDFIVFIMSSGEAIVYQGSSPAATGDFALVGIYNIGTPLSDRGFTKFGGDIIGMTSLDFTSVAQLLQGKEANIQPSKIIGSILNAVENYKNNWGWEVIVYPKDKLLIFNIPITTNVEYHQYVMNLSTKSWCRFKGITSNTFAVFKDKLYAGCSGGEVRELLIGLTDQGEAIESQIQTAWLDFNNSSRKRFVAVKNIIKVSSPIAITLDTQTDFGTFPTISFPSPLTQSGTPWGSPWGSPWGIGRIYVIGDWMTLNQHGRMISMRLTMSTKQEAEWYGSHWLLQGSERI